MEKLFPFLKSDISQRSAAVILFISVFLSAVRCQSCGKQLEELEGSLSHEEYPDDYSANANCQWSTVARENDTVSIEFELLAVEADRDGGCTYDYVSIKFPTKDNPEKFCGLPRNRDPNKDLTTNGTGGPVIKFVSDDSVQHPGFLLHYKIERYDYCMSSPCENEGSCTLEESFEDGWGCTCVSGWTGKVCDADFDECEAEPCENEGSCSTPEFDMFACACVAGFIGDRCETNIDECESSPCRNGATCNDSINSYNCHCLDGYTGTQCEIDIDECATDPCLNDGICVDELNSYRCECNEGYEGTNCETDIDDCESSPCRNNGSCIDQINSFKCACAEGYQGKMCDQDIDECTSGPCHNGGSCTDEIAGYTCTCADGYTSDTCAVEMDECDSHPCQNGAPCVDHPAAYECICKNGFTGTNCEVEPSENEGKGSGCDPNPCLNGGSCVEEEKDFHCRCTDRYEGTTCQIENSQQNGSLVSTLLPVIIFVLLAGAIAALCYRYFRRRKQHKSRARPIKVKPYKEKESRNIKKSTSRKEKNRRKPRKKTKQKTKNIDPESDETDIVSIVDEDIRRMPVGMGVSQPTQGIPRFENMQPTYPNYQGLSEQPGRFAPNGISAPLHGGMFPFGAPRMPAYNPGPLYQNPYNYSMPTQRQDNPYNFHNYAPPEIRHIDNTQYSSDDTSSESSSLSTLSNQYEMKQKYHLRKGNSFHKQESDVSSLYSEQSSQHPSSCTTYRSAEDHPQQQQQHYNYKQHTLPGHPSPHFQQSQETNHWQDRDDRKSNWIPSTHKYYELEGDVDPEIVKSLKKAGKIKEHHQKRKYFQNTSSLQRRNTSKGTGFHFKDRKANVIEPLKPTRKTTNLSKMQKQSTTLMPRKSILSTGLRGVGSKKSPNKRITFGQNTHILAPIKEDPLLESWEGGDALPRMRRETNRGSRKYSVQAERHPPDGGISSSEEVADKKFDKSRNQPKRGNDGPDISKDESRSTIFKLIRKSSFMNMNRGRGFARENAFIKKL